MLSKAIISVSAWHSGHQARVELRPRSINKESVSIVTFVCFAISLLSELARVLKNQRSLLETCLKSPYKPSEKF